MKCIICNKKLKGLQKKYCSRFCKSKFHYPSNIDTQKNRGNERKAHFIKVLGGQCSMCGYDKCLDALCFHHIKNKKFTLDKSHLRSKSLKTLEQEVKKCILLCSNCHMESHHPDLKMSAIKYDSCSTQKLKSIKRKLMIMEQRGNKCQHCHYNKNMAALCFHHMNPATKSIKLDFRSLGNYSLEIINNELNKCQLLCSNCHLEIHSNNH